MDYGEMRAVGREVKEAVSKLITVGSFLHAGGRNQLSTKPSGEKNLQQVWERSVYMALSSCHQRLKSS